MKNRKSNFIRCADLEPGVYVIRSAGFYSATRDSIGLQGLVACTLVIPIAWLAATYYYKSGSRTDGWLVALVMVTTALLLDVIITVPFFEMPYHGRSHYQFFTHPLLWIIVLEDVLMIYLYQRAKVKSTDHA